mmetsp:Transcript_24690/g.30817  ORF Transcript_24690/g.30817 Transcript_24690/m.30817 type:complete len:129 (+) Transcript_24690:504-890(+)
MDDGLGDAMRHNARQAIKLFSPAAFAVASYFALATLPSYLEQRVITIIFVNLVLSNITLNLMLNNMAGRKFSVAQPSLALPLVPVAAYHVLSCSAQTEIMLSNSLTIFAGLIWASKMVSLSIQWCDFS